MTSAGPVGPCVLHRSNCGSPAVSLLTFCSWFFSLEAPTRRVAGALPYRSGPTAGRSPRLSLRPLNISTSQVGAGAHPVTALSFFLLHLGAILFFPLSFLNKKHIELYHRSCFNVNPSVAWLTVVCFYTRFFFLTISTNQSTVWSVNVFCTCLFSDQGSNIYRKPPIYKQHGTSPVILWSFLQYKLNSVFLMINLCQWFPTGYLLWIVWKIHTKWKQKSKDDEAKTNKN